MHAMCGFSVLEQACATVVYVMSLHRYNMYPFLTSLLHEENGGVDANATWKTLLHVACKYEVTDPVEGGGCVA